MKSTTETKNKQRAESVSAADHEVRRANLRSRKTRRFWVWSLLLGLLAIVLAVAAWLYVNRDREIVELRVVAGPYRSDSYELMQQVADVVSRQSKLLRIKVIATKDSSQNISILNSGDADLATIRSDTPVVADVRVITDLFPDYFQLISGQNSAVNRIPDLEGKKVAIPPFGTDEFRSFWAIADHYDLSITGVKWLAMPFSKASEKLLSGEIDALFTVRSLRDRLILNLFEDASLKNFLLRLVEIDQAKAISLKRPFLSSNVIPKGTYSGQPAIPFSDMNTSAVKRTLVTREDVDAELIGELTRILFEHRLDLTIRFALASAITSPVDGIGLSAPLHLGAERFFNRDQPSFLQENAEPIALMITIAAMLFSGLLALRSRLMSGQKNRMDSYNYILLDIAERARKTGKPALIAELKNEHYAILEKVVRALDTDEVTEEGFQSFSLLWESVREVLNERQGELHKA